MEINIVKPRNKTIEYGVYLGLALILSYAESMIPFSFGLPGLKLGLTNLIVVIMLYNNDAYGAISVSLIRIILSGILFGNPFSILYSLGGGLLSFLVMLLLKKTKQFQLITVSIAGGFFHNLGQILIASIVVGNTGLFFYFPILGFGGMVTGFFIGYIALELLHRLPFRTGDYL